MFELHDGSLVNKFAARNTKFPSWKYHFNDSTSGDLKAEEVAQEGNSYSNKQLIWGFELLQRKWEEMDMHDWNSGISRRQTSSCGRISIVDGKWA